LPRSTPNIDQHADKTADLLFVFGTREDVARRDERPSGFGARLVRWSIVSGGATPGSELSECEIIKAAMVARGIPLERILEEHRATNTGENVIFSLAILEAVLGLRISARDLLATPGRRAATR